MKRRLLRYLARAGFLAALALLFVLAAYWSFNTFIRRGVTTVPEVLGVGREEAAERLAARGLRLRAPEEGERYDDQVAVGLIVQQDPPEGSLVKEGSAVEAVVSRGPQLVEVPDLAGQVLQAAQVTLSAAGLTVGPTATVYSVGGEPGTVVEQEPPAGSRVARSTPVSLYLCLEDRARTFLMPDLVYRDSARTIAQFRRRGFKVGSVKFESYEGIAPGVVLRQFPLPGHPLRQRDVISLVVSTDERTGT